MKEKLLFTWSGGKDSAFALYEIAKTQKYEITALLTTVTEEYDRISMHGVKRVLLEQQAKSLGFPVEKVFISKNASNDEYATKMREVLEKYTRLGVHSVAFGDIFLEDVAPWLDMHEIRYISGVKFTGKSGYDHLFDFVIPKSRKQPERIVRAINHPSRDNV